MTTHLILMTILDMILVCISLIIFSMGIKDYLYTYRIHNAIHKIYLAYGILFLSQVLTIIILNKHLSNILSK